MIHHRRFVSIALIMSSGAMIPAAYAEEAQPSANAESNGDIIVTARKRDERLQDVPVAMAVFSKDDLTRYNTESIAQVASQTPSLVIGSTASSTGGVINLRGVGAATSSPTIDQAVSINLDGIQISQANVLQLGLQDVGRIEILKGPQALFYGKNSPGGVISIISADPTPEFEGKLRAGYEFAARKPFVEGTISTPLTPHLGLRINAFYSEQDGYFRNDAVPIPAAVIPAALGGGLTSPGVGTTQRRGPNQKNLVVRGTLAYEAPGGILDAKLKVAYGSQDRKNGLTFGSQIFYCANGAPNFVLLMNSAGSRDCSLNRTVNEADVPAAIAALHPSYRDGRAYFENKQVLTSLTTNLHPSDNLTITSVTGYYNLREKFSGNFTFGSSYYAGNTADLNVKQFTEELRATTKFDGMFNFMVGGFYQDARLRTESPGIFDNPLSGLYSGGAFKGPNLFLNPVQHQTTKAWSVFGQVIVDISPKLQFSAGGRYSDERKNVRARVLPTAFNAAAYDVIFTPNRRSFNDFSPDVTLTYKPNTDLSLYAAFREGFKSGGFNLTNTAGGFGSRNGGNQSFDQEQASGGEIGAKGWLLDRQVQFDVAVYNYKYKGLQVAAFNALTLSAQVTNAASARVKGVDFSTVIRPRELEGLSIRSAVSYNHARYLKFVNSQCYTGQSKAAGCNFVATGSGGALTVTPATAAQTGNVQNLSGRPLTRSQDWSGNIGLTYDTNVSNGYVVSLYSDAIYSDGYMADPLQNPNAYQKSAWRLNAGVTLKSPGDRWELSLVGTNLTNVLRIVNAYNTVGSGGGTGTNAARGTDLAGTVSDPIGVTLSGTIKF